MLVETLGEALDDIDGESLGWSGVGRLEGFSEDWGVSAEEGFDVLVLIGAFEIITS